jgi:riboflavin kinase / FMN adenylyltransferase
LKILTINDTLPPGESCAVTIGNFDGVHLGHQKLLTEVVTRAAASGRKSVVITFEPHTRLVVEGETAYSLLTGFEEKARLIELMGVDYLMLLAFDKTMSEMEPDAFISRILVEKLHVVEWVMGTGHTIGRKRALNEIFLRETEDKYHFKTFVADLLAQNGSTVSSTQIRNFIAQGQIAEAVAMLGHPYLLSVERTRGLQLGTKLGYPTINFRKPPSRKVIPPPGVYAAELEYNGYLEPGALYFGASSTVPEHRDIHFEFFSFARGKEEIAEGDNAHLWLYSFIRKDTAFKTTDELVRQIAVDVQTIKTYFMKERKQWR